MTTADRRICKALAGDMVHRRRTPQRCLEIIRAYVRETS